MRYKKHWIETSNGSQTRIPAILQAPDSGSPGSTLRGIHQYDGPQGGVPCVTFTRRGKHIMSMQVSRRCDI